MWLRISYWLLISGAFSDTLENIELKHNSPF